MAEAFVPRAQASVAEEAATAARPPCHDPGKLARDQRVPFQRSISGVPGLVPLLA
jgi:hypothetical protein